MFAKSNDGVQPLSIAEQQQSLTVAKSARHDTDDQISTISRGVTIVGKILCEGTVHVLGQIEGELRALTVSINEGAKMEGEVVAEELTVGGVVKGSIRANRVKLTGTAVVEGDIIHRSLLVEENARFEGSSKRQDGASDLSSTLPQQPAAPGGGCPHNGNYHAGQKLIRGLIDTVLESQKESLD
jgi:cytoskeletal protein CcmA (bactofilin family)